MSLDITLTKLMTTEVYQTNITHNIGIMAAQCQVAAALTLYAVIWRPEEHGLTHARQLIPFLTLGLQKLREDPLKYKAHNPENGWGSYEGLLDLVRLYRDACEEHPDAEVHVCR